VRRRTWIASTLAAGALALAGCGSGGATGAGTPGPAGAAAPAGAPSAVLTTWTSPLGQVVVTSNGAAVYLFDQDRPGAAASACTGVCANLWHAVTTPSGTPQVSGLTGTLGTVAGTGGARQLTLDGHRLYTYTGDSPGQLNGEGVMGIWWVVSPAGQPIHQAAAAPSSADPGYSY
jgi:predicted lipoprotein with Yx(FWY)xxD motif